MSIYNMAFITIDRPKVNLITIIAFRRKGHVILINPTPIGHTRIFKSGDPMKVGGQIKLYFFGTRTAEFPIDIPNSQRSNNTSLIGTINNSNEEKGAVSRNDISNTSNIRVLDGSENGTKVKLELSTIPETVVAGKSVTLVLKVKNAGNDTLVTHPDALLVIRNESDKLLKSASAGSPLVQLMELFTDIQAS
jgi:hypothetical protein